MEPGAPETDGSATAPDQAVTLSESHACFWAGLHAVGVWCLALALTPRSLRESGLMLLWAALALALSLRFGMAQPLEAGRSRFARIVRLALFAGLSGFVSIAVLVYALGSVEGLTLAVLGAVFVALAQRRKRPRTRPSSRALRRLEGAAWLGALALPALIGYVSEHCLSARLRYGLDASECPEGRVLQSVRLEASGLRRGAEGSVQVTPWAHYTTGAADAAFNGPLPGVEPDLELLDARGKATPLKPKRGGWTFPGQGAYSDAIALPEQLADGDYTLRATVRTELGESSVQAPLPIYAPARIHVLSDRPLYEPGNLVQFRALVLRASDLTPLDGRPGRWEVRDPHGEVVLEEQADAGNWGVATGSFTLDEHADSGRWTVRYVSAQAEDEVPITVEPFRLPRFRVEADAAQPFYTAGAQPLLRGRVVYSSGAPVADAALELSWRVEAETLREGSWPPPGDWERGGLPVSASTDAAGAFELTLPTVPDDLRGRVWLRASIAAVDGAGDRVSANASVLLSADALRIETQTELAGGLIDGFNNRVYLRATRTDGSLLPGVKLRVKRAWQPDDPGVEAETDADGVAAVQIDPGPAVNVVLAPMPLRPLLRAAQPVTVTRDGATELLTGVSASLLDQRTMDGWIATLEPCARFADSEPYTRTTHVRVSAAGAVLATVPSETDALGECIAASVARTRFAAGKERLFEVRHALSSELPSVRVEVQASTPVPSALSVAIDTALAEARGCLGRDNPDGALPRLLTWTPNAAAKSHAFGFAADPQSPRDVVAASVSACVERTLLSKLDWTRDVQEKKDWTTSIGFARLRVEGQRADDAPQAPEPLTLLGYELAVSASRGDEALGETRVVLDQGQVPPLRLRAEPVLAAPGERVAVRVLRGPEFSGELPDELVMRHRLGELKAHLDRGDHTARFTLPKDAKGWLEVRVGEARALVFVRSASDLAVDLVPGAARYAPGELAELRVRTTEGGVPARAAVGLFGVDDSLAQLTTLPGADDMARLRVLPPMLGAALGALDAAALELGRVRGANAAAAVVLQVGELPAPEAHDAVLYASAAEPFDPVAMLTDSFYGVLDELRGQVRGWEKSAAKVEKMRPATMAKLWQRALDACKARNEPIEDSFGRTLTLQRLPPDLLALVDPRLLVVDGTRLPEDVENWAAWVAKEHP